jgi:mono/diheme cytochrome c family protein
MLPAGSAESNKNQDNWTTPPEAAGIENPYPVTQAAMEKGKVVFTQQCTPCHGASGKGDGPAGEFLGKPLPDFSKVEFQEQSDGELFWKLSKGKAPMPMFEEILSEEQRWMVVGYLRTLLTKKQ